MTGLHNLQTLHLEANRFTVLEADWFAELTRLQMLDLRPIAYETFYGLTRQERLDLFRSTHPACLPRGAFAGRSSLELLTRIRPCPPPISSDL